MNDVYARQVVRAGQDLGISPRGIVAALATVFVESNWVMYANEADPDSLSFPHEALSYDANSVGLFQQRSNWWGTCADRMDPYRSAVMFFNRLKKFDYNDLSHTPGYWAQQVQGSAFPDRYDKHVGDAQELYDRIVVPWVRPKGAMEKVLKYSRSAVGAYDGVSQQRSWDCGPASAQIILQSAGVLKDEQYLIDRIGTTVDGTNHAGMISPILNELMPGSGYRVVWLSREPVSKADVDALWNNVKRSIDAGRGAVINFEAPPTNFPRATRGDTSPEYRGWNTIYHYVACMGYADDGPGGRHFWIADPGFRPFGYWISLEQVASLIVPHAYAYAADAPVIAATKNDPAPVPVPVPPVIPPAAPSNAELSAKVEKLSTALSLLLKIIEQTNPEILRAYITATKGK